MKHDLSKIKSPRIRQVMRLWLKDRSVKAGCANLQISQSCWSGHVADGKKILGIAPGRAKLSKDANALLPETHAGEDGMTKRMLLRNMLPLNQMGCIV